MSKGKTHYVLKDWQTWKLSGKCVVTVGFETKKVDITGEVFDRCNCETRACNRIVKIDGKWCQAQAINLKSKLIGLECGPLPTGWFETRLPNSLKLLPHFWKKGPLLSRLTPSQIVQKEATRHQITWDQCHVVLQDCITTGWVHIVAKG